MIFLELQPALLWTPCKSPKKGYLFFRLLFTCTLPSTKEITLEFQQENASGEPKTTKEVKLSICDSFLPFCVRHVHFVAILIECRACISNCSAVTTRTPCGPIPPPRTSIKGYYFQMPPTAQPRSQGLSSLPPFSSRIDPQCWFTLVTWHSSTNIFSLGKCFRYILIPQLG